MPHSRCRRSKNFLDVRHGSVSNHSRNRLSTARRMDRGGDAVDRLRSGGRSHLAPFHAMPNLIVDTAQWSWPSPATLLPTSKQAGRVFALESGDSRKLVEDFDHALRGCFAHTAPQSPAISSGDRDVSDLPAGAAVKALGARNDFLSRCGGMLILMELLIKGTSLVIKPPGVWIISRSAPLDPRLMCIASAPASVTTLSQCSTFDIVASCPDFGLCAPARGSSKPHKSLLPKPDRGILGQESGTAKPLISLSVGAMCHDY